MTERVPAGKYPACLYWSQLGDGEWNNDGLGLGAVNFRTGVTPTVTCATYHLSAFTISEDSVSPQFNAVDLFGDYDVIMKVGAYVARSGAITTAVMYGRSSVHLIERITLHLRVAT